MKSRTLTFAKRQGHYQLVPAGTGVIVTPEDSVYLTIEGDKEPPPDPAERMTSDELAGWLRTLRSEGYALKAVDGYNHPLKTDPDAK